MSELEPTLTYSNHTATEVLRRMLDERGVEWEDMSIRPYACTSWRDPDGEPCTALEGADDIPDGKLSAQALLTPAQAIAAPLGTGTCHIDVRNGDWYCDACGEMVGTRDPASELFIDGNAIDIWKYCPFCGRRIEQ